MFTQKTIFYIPIYRQTKDQYYKELKIDFDKHEKRRLELITDEEELKHFCDENVREGSYFYYQNRYSRWSEKESIESWELNQIIGWIEFYAHASNIKANLWFIKSKRINKRPRNKTFVFTGRLGDVTNTIDIKYSDLLPEILKFVEEVRKGEYGYKYLKKYFIPDKIFLHNTMFFDTKALFNSFTQR